MKLILEKQALNQHEVKLLKAQNLIVQLFYHF
jgi:hypothetical protein